MTQSFSIDQVIMWGLIDGEIFEEILDFHYMIKAGLLTLDELYNIKPLPFAALEVQPTLSVFNGVSGAKSSSSSSSVPTNGTSFGAANKSHGIATGPAHKTQLARPIKLKPEKLSLNGKVPKNAHPMVVQCPLCLEHVAGTRFAPHLEKCMNGGKRGSIGTRKPDLYGDEVHTKVKTVFMDPYPNSPIVRIKLRNGLPRATQLREGATLEEFLALQQQADAEG